MTIIQLHGQPQGLRVPPVDCGWGVISDLLAGPEDEDGRLHLDPAAPLAEITGLFIAWVERRRLPWLLLCGDLAAPVLLVLGRRLDLRIGGAVLVAPAGWKGDGATVALPLAPLAFPAVLVRGGSGRRLAQATARRLAEAWGIADSAVIDRFDGAAPGDDPRLRGLMLRRAAALRRAGLPLSPWPH